MERCLIGSVIRIVKFCVLILRCNMLRRSLCVDWLGEAAIWNDDDLILNDRGLFPLWRNKSRSNPRDEQSRHHRHRS